MLVSPISIPLLLANLEGQHQHSPAARALYTRAQKNIVTVQQSKELQYLTCTMILHV